MPISGRCAISGEKTLPTLETAHIKPYAESGPHAISNGLLLRSDLHKLFDSGYLILLCYFNGSADLQVRDNLLRAGF